MKFNINKIVEINFNYSLDNKELFSLNNKNLEIIYSNVDNDIHLIPFLEKVDNKIQFKEIFFEYKEYPLTTKALILLTKSIELDNLNSNYETIYEDDKNIILNFLLSNDISVDGGKSFSILHDDYEGNINNKLIINTYKDSISIIVNDINGLRFRTKSGGGKCHRVRNILSLICYLIKNDIK